MHKAKVEDVKRSIYTVTYVLLDSLPVKYYRGATTLSLKRRHRCHTAHSKMFRRTSGTEILKILCALCKLHGLHGYTTTTLSGTFGAWRLFQNHSYMDKNSLLSKNLYRRTSIDEDSTNMGLLGESWKFVALIPSAQEIS